MKPTREQVIAWAREACGEPAWSGGVEWTWEEVEHFANLVAAAQREWKGLTKEEARELCVANVPYVVDMVAALEARLKEKNT
jgi:hypothetical protein